MGRSRIVFDCHTWKILSFTLDSCHHTPRGRPYWEPSKYNCNGNTERIYYPFWSASMDGTITSAAKKKGPLKLGPPAAPAASCTRECHISSYFCMAAYIWKILAALPKSHIFQVEKYLKLSVKLVWIKFKRDPSKPYCSACCKGLLAKAASKSPGNRSRQEKIHDPQLWKLQNTFKKPVKLFKSEENFASERDTFLDTETLQIANDLDATWSRPCKYLFCSLSSRPSASPHTSLVDSMHHQKSPKKKQHSSHFKSRWSTK